MVENEAKAGQPADVRGYELAIAEGRRALDSQDAHIKGSRDRVVSLLGFGGLSAAFLTGVAATKHGTPTNWTWVALLGFLLQAGITVVALWPRHQTPGGASPKTLAENADANAYLAVARSHALDLSDAYCNNMKAADRLADLTTAALVCFAVILGALVLDLMMR